MFKSELKELEMSKEIERAQGRPSKETKKCKTCGEDVPKKRYKVTKKGRLSAICDDCRINESHGEFKLPNPLDGLSKKEIEQRRDNALRALGKGSILQGGKIPVTCLDDIIPDDRHGVTFYN